MSQVLFFVSHTLLLLTAWLVTDRTVDRSRGWQRAAQASLLFMLGALTLALLLALPGLLTPEAQVGACAVLCLGSGVAWWRSRRPSISSPVGEAEPQPWWKKQYLPLTAALLCLTFVPNTALARMPSRFFDDLTYHAPAIYNFLKEGSLAIAETVPYQRWYPYNAELIASWFFLPNGSDTYWIFVGSVWMIVCLLQLRSLVDDQKVHSMAPWAAAMAFCASETTWKQMRREATTDLAAAALMLGMLAVLRSLEERLETGGRVRFTLVMAGAAAGAVVGTKISNSVVVLPVVVYLGVCLRHRTRRELIVDALSFGLPLVALGSCWYLRNLIATGNPLYPAEFGPFWGPFDGESQDRTKLITWLFGAQGELGTNWKNAFDSFFTRAGFLVALALIGTLLKSTGLLRAAAKNRFRLPAALHFDALLVACVWVVLLSFPLMPFSGAPNNDTAPLRVAVRFVLAFLPLGYLFFAERGKPWAAILAVSAVASLFTYRDLDHVIVGLVAAAAVFLILNLLQVTKLSLRWATSAAVVASLLALAIAEPWLAEAVDEKTFARSYYRKGAKLRLGRAWKALEALPPGKRIACVGVADHQTAGLYGRRLQHQPVLLFPDGTAYPPDLDRVWLELRKDKRWWEPWFPESRRFSVDNLREARIDYLLVQRMTGSSWPNERRALKRHRRARRVANGNSYELWSIKR